MGVSGKLDQFAPSERIKDSRFNAEAQMDSKKKKAFQR
jgi:hypothetical protein